MFVTFDTLPGTSRLWIFQAEQKFTPQELTIIHKQLELFTQQWAAHGQPLQTSFQVLEDRFIVLAVNERIHEASGCSIDSSVHTIKEIGNLIHQDLFKRNLVSFKMGDGIKTIALNELKDAFNKGIWNENTLTFNTLVGNKSQFENEWLVPAKSLWLKRYIGEGVAQ
jgi:hypothetical protein